MSSVCQICNTESSVFYKDDRFTLLRCPRCDHAFTDLRLGANLELYTSEYYDEKHKNWFLYPNNKLFRVIEKLVEPIGPGASVIDVGCGRGALLSYLHERHHDWILTGIDYSIACPLRDINFIQGDILKLDFNRQFDVVISLAVIEHVEDVQRFMKKVISLAKPAGIIAIMTLNDRSILYAVSRFLRMLGFNLPFERLYDKHHLHHFSVGSLKYLMEVNQLKVIKEIHHNSPMKAVDLPPCSPFLKMFLYVGVWLAFALGQLTGRAYLQTLVCKK